MSEFFLERKNEGYAACIDEVSDSRTQPELLGGRIVILLSELMRKHTEFIGTPTELAEQIDPVGTEGITPKKVSRLILQSVDALRKIGISAVVRRSNGKRLIELHRAESDDAAGTLSTLPGRHAAVCGRFPDAANKLPQAEKKPCQAACGRNKTSHTKAPAKTQRSGFGRKRRHSGVNEFSPPVSDGRRNLSLERASRAPVRRCRSAHF